MCCGLRCQLYSWTHNNPALVLCPGWLEPSQHVWWVFPLTCWFHHWSIVTSVHRTLQQMEQYDHLTLWKPTKDYQHKLHQVLLMLLNASMMYLLWPLNVTLCTVGRSSNCQITLPTHTWCHLRSLLLDMTTHFWFACAPNHIGPFILGASLGLSSLWIH